jgi:hypothetical protein
MTCDLDLLNADWLKSPWQMDGDDFCPAARVQLGMFKYGTTAEESLFRIAQRE